MAAQTRSKIFRRRSNNNNKSLKFPATTFTHPAPGQQGPRPRVRRDAAAVARPPRVVYVRGAGRVGGGRSVLDGGRAALAGLTSTILRQRGREFGPKFQTALIFLFFEPSESTTPFWKQLGASAGVGFSRVRDQSFVGTIKLDHDNRTT